MKAAFAKRKEEEVEWESTVTTTERISSQYLVFNKAVNYKFVNLSSLEQGIEKKLIQKILAED